MKQTTNYQLNQWEKTDRILMEDFNRDNARLDTGLAAVADLPHGELICGGITKQAVPQIDLDVSKVDWSRYVLAFIRVQMPMFRNAMLRLNRGDIAHYMDGGESRGIISHLDSFNGVVAILPVLYDGTRPFFTVTLSGKPTVSRHSKPLNGDSPFTLSIGDNDSNKEPLPAGTLFELWGVR